MKQLIPLQPQEIGSPWLQLQPVHIESILHQQRSIINQYTFNNLVAAIRKKRSFKPLKQPAQRVCLQSITNQHQVSKPQISIIQQKIS